MKVAFTRLSDLSFSLLLSFAAVVVALQSCSAAAPILPKPPVGQPAPDFSLLDLAGKTVKLSDYKKKFVVLEWFSDECPFVHKHYDSGNMQVLQKEAVAKGVVWLTICSSAPGKPGYHETEEHRQIVKKWKGAMSDFLTDASGNVGRMYGSKNTPTMYIIGKDGTLLYEGAIDDKPDADQDSVKGAKNYVREALDQATSGKGISISVTKAYG
jgi:peroxiredoxin